jgi:hypothetical protein
VVFRLIFAVLAAALGPTTSPASAPAHQRTALAHLCTAPIAPVAPAHRTEPIAPCAQSAPVAPNSDLDSFMERVLARRDDNWKKMQQYVLEEEERLQLTGPDGSRLYGYDRDYTWFIRQGYFIRSPLRVDGVRIGEAERARAEEQWLERERAREKRAQERAKSRGEEVPADPRTAAGEPPATVEDVLKESLEPRFVSAAYFLRFKFDPGHYALAGRERLNDRDVLKIEYYPSKLFTEGRTRPNKRVRDRDDEIEEKMNKVSLVTLWIDPTEHQIVQYTFDNIDMDFLPGRSLVRVDEVKASMKMAEPFPNVWLPGTIDMRFQLTMAIGSVAARYDIAYRDYRLAEVTTRIRP